MSDAKLFPDDTPLFSIAHCLKTSASVLNSDLLKIQKWVYQGRYLLMQTKLNKCKTLHFPERLITLFIRLSTLAMQLLHSRRHRRHPITVHVFVELDPWKTLLLYIPLTHFSPLSHFYTPSGGIKMWHWTKMG